MLFINRNVFVINESYKVYFVLKNCIILVEINIQLKMLLVRSCVFKCGIKICMFIIHMYTNNVTRACQRQVFVYFKHTCAVL